jgi:hypothetical protein
VEETFNWKTSFVEARESEWHWAKQPSGAISLPDFIQLRAKGEAKMTDGHVYLKKAGSDPELVNLFRQRIAAMTKSLYEGTEDIKDLLKG